LRLDIFIAAVRSAMRTCNRMPAAVELRRLSGEMATSDRSALAWGSLIRAIGQHGHYCSVDFDDPVINAAVRNLGGWHRLCALDQEELEKWTRKDFERVYSSMCSSGVTAELSQYLCGEFEINNSSRGYKVEPPTRVVTGLPPHREGVMRELPANDEGSLPRLSGTVAGKMQLEARLK